MSQPAEQTEQPEQNSVEVPAQVMSLLYDNAKNAADANKKALECTEILLRQAIEQNKALVAEVERLKNEVLKGNEIIKSLSTSEPKVEEVTI